MTTNNEHRIKVTGADHRTIKTLASAAGKTIIAFVPDLIKAYKANRKGGKQ